MERELGLTREVIKTLAASCCRVQIITKSTLVARDADLLKEIPATVAVTITTDNEEVTRVIEPNAPSPLERFKAIETLTNQGISVIVRVDPIIPYANNDYESLFKRIASLNVKHVTVSTYKARSRDWKRLSEALPDVAQKLAQLYWTKGEYSGGSMMLPRDLRLELLSRIRRVALHWGLRFAVCREGLAELNTATCDGSWLLPETQR